MRSFTFGSWNAGEIIVALKLIYLIYLISGTVEVDESLFQELDDLDLVENGDEM